MPKVISAAAMKLKRSWTTSSILGASPRKTMAKITVKTGAKLFFKEMVVNLKYLKIVYLIDLLPAEKQHLKSIFHN
jgi:hypothetical protein